MQLDSHLIKYTFVVFTLSIFGCSFNNKIGAEPADSIGVLMPASESAYSASVWTSGPVFEFIRNGEVDVTATGEITITPFTDESCTQAAPGIFSAANLTVPLTNGAAAFTGLSYTSSTPSEESIYLGVEYSEDPELSKCAGPTAILKKFNTGIGGAFFENAGTSTAGGLNDIITDGFEDSQGRYLITANSGNAAGRSEPVVWRFNPNGTLDITFGGTGYVIMNHNIDSVAGRPAATKSDSFVSIRQDSQGRYVIGGTSQNAAGRTEIFAVRLLNNGTLDTTYATSGIFRYLPDGAGLAGALAASRTESMGRMVMDSQDRPLFAGRSRNAAGGFEAYVIRLTSSGAVDTSFGVGGVALYQPGGVGMAGESNATKNDRFMALAIDLENRIVGITRNTLVTGEQFLGLVRFTSTGVIDTTFGTNGATVFQQATTSAGGVANTTRIDWGQEIKVDSQGRYVIAGMSNRPAQGNRGTVWRYATNGSIDTTFNTTGYRVIAEKFFNGVVSSSDDEFFGMAIDKEGRYILGGWAPGTGFGYAALVCRMKTDGALDTTFATTSGNLAGCVAFEGTGPSITGRPAATKFDLIFTMLSDKHGRPVGIGYAQNAAGRYRPVIYRLKPNGDIDK